MRIPRGSGLRTRSDRDPRLATPSCPFHGARPCPSAPPARLSPDGYDQLLRSIGSVITSRLTAVEAASSPSRMYSANGPGDRRRGRRAVRAALDRPSRPVSTDSTPPGCDCVRTSSVTSGRRRTAPHFREALPLADGVSEGSLALDRLGLGDRPRDVAGRVRRIAGCMACMRSSARGLSGQCVGALWARRVCCEIDRSCVLPDAVCLRSEIVVPMAVVWR